MGEIMEESLKEKLNEMKLQKKQIDNEIRMIKQQFKLSLQEQANELNEKRRVKKVELETKKLRIVQNKQKKELFNFIKEFYKKDIDYKTFIENVKYICEQKLME